MTDLMRADGVQIVRQTLRELGGGRYRVQAFGEADALDRLTEAGFEVERIENVPRVPPAMSGGRIDVGPPPGRERGPIGKGAPRPLPAPPEGPGRAPGGYLSVEDVESRIDELAAKYARAATVIDLPHRPCDQESGCAQPVLARAQGPCRGTG